MSWRLPNVAWDQNLLCECAGLTNGGAKSYPAMHATECVQHAHVRERIYRLSISRRPRARGAPELEPLLVRTMMIMYTFFVFVDMHNQFCGIDVILCTVSAGAIALVLVLTRPATAAAAVCMHM